MSWMKLGKERGHIAWGLWGIGRMVVSLLAWRGIAKGRLGVMLHPADQGRFRDPGTPGYRASGRFHSGDGY